MTDHDDTNDPIDAALDDAGKRLRRQAPGDIASRQALARMNERADAPTPATIMVAGTDRRRSGSSCGRRRDRHSIRRQ